MSDKNFKIKNGLDANGAVTITQPDISTTPLTIFANTVATGSDLLQVKRPDGTVRFAVGNDGALTVKSNINFTGGNMTMYPANSAQTALIVIGQTNQSVANLIVKAATNQSGNLQEWRDQNNNIAVSIGPDFAIRGIAGGFFGTASGNIVGVNYLGVKGWAASHIPFVVQGFASQTGDLTRWVDSSANTLAKVDASGSITAVDLTLSGNLTVNGTTTNLNSTNLVIEDKNIIIADVTTPTDTTADGAGITIKGATDKTLNWVQSTKSFTTSEPVIINNSSTDVPTLIVKLNTGQTSSIQEWRDHAGNVVAKIGPLYGSNVFQFDPFSYGAGSGYSSIWIGGRGITNEQRAAQSKFGVTTGEWVLGALRATDNQVGAFAASTTLPTFVVKGVASQTSSLQEWQNNSGTVLAYVDSTGRFLSTRPFRTDDVITAGSQSSTLGQISAISSSSTRIGLVVQGAVSQTANLQEWQTSSGTVLASINSNGGLFIKPASTSGNLLKFENTGNTYGWTVPANYANSIVFDVSNDPRIYWGSSMIWTMEATPNTSVIRPYTSDRYAISLRGLSGQTGDLTQWQNSAGTTLAKVDSSGNITAPSYNLSNSLYSLRKTIKKTVGDGTAVPINTTYDLFQFSFSASLQGTFYFQVSMRGPGYGQNLTYSLPVTYIMDWLWNGYSGNLFTNNTTWVSLTPQTFSGRHMMIGDDLKLQAKVDANTIYFRLKANAALSSGGGSPYFDVYIQHSEEFAGCSITEYSTTGTDTNSQTTLANFLSSKGGTTELFNPVTIFSNSASNTPLKVKGYASQTANLQEWQNNSGTALVTINQYGSLVVSGNLQTNTYFSVGSAARGTEKAFILNDTATNVGLIVKGATSQSASLQQWQNSSGTVLSSFSSIGRLAINTSSDAGGRALYVVQPNGGYGVVFEGAGTVQNVSIYAASGGVGLVIAGAASQTANLQEWQNSAGTPLSYINASGGLTATEVVGSTTYSGGKITGGTLGYLNASTFNASVSPIVVRGAASQTADLQQWQNSSGTVLGKIDAYGTFAFNTGGHSIAGPNPAQIALRIYGASSQTADLQQWINSSNTVMAKVDANGNFSAISKSFDIEHPTKENMRLRYASLEAPENGVYIRGTATTNIIELPDYWTGLVHEDSITVSLTSVGSAQNIYVEKIENNKVYIGGDLEKAFFTVYGERKDIDKLTVEY